jgi:Ca-activated chloride channel family protein
VQFGSPISLLTLLVVPSTAALALVAYRRPGRSPVAFTNLEILAGVAGSRTPRRAWIPLGLLLIALAVAATAVAQPRVLTTKTEAHAVVVMLVDVSGSMNATDVRPSRVTAAVKAMRTFIGKLPGQVELGLVEFSDAPVVIELPTTQHDQVAGALDLLSPGGGTALGDGLATAVDIVRTTLANDGVRVGATKAVPGAIVLLSDGAQNRGTLSPLHAAARANAAGIRVDTISFGTAGGTMRFVGVSGAVAVPPDPGTMKAIAGATGGLMFSARTAAETSTIYETLGSSIGRKSERYSLTSWFALGAGLLLAAAVSFGRSAGPALP